MRNAPSKYMEDNGNQFSQRREETRINPRCWISIADVRLNTWFKIYRDRATQRYT